MGTVNSLGNKYSDRSGAVRELQVGEPPNAAGPAPRYAGSRSVPPMEGAFKCLQLFVIVYCARPEDWVPLVGFLPLARITGIIALVAFGLSVRSRKGPLRLPRENAYLIALSIQLCLAAILSPVWKGGATVHALNFTKVATMILVAALTVTTLPRLRSLVFVQVAAVAGISVMAIVKGLHDRTGRLEGVLNGIYSNPNDLALAIVLAMPFCLVFLFETHSILRKAVWAILMLLMSYALLLTASRGGTLTLLIAGTVCLWEFGLKGKRFYLIVLAGIVGPALLLLGGGRLMERIDASLNPGKDRAAFESAQERRELLVRSIEVTAQHPLFGVGPGDFKVISGNWHESHNVFTQISSEAGVPALILLLLILGRAFANLRGTKRLAQGRPEILMWSAALRADLTAFAVGSFFFPVAYHFFPYFLVAYSGALLTIAGGRENAVLPCASPAAQKARVGGKDYGLRSKSRDVWTVS